MSVQLTAVQGLPNHFLSEESEFSNILELSPSIRRILTAILRPGCNTSPGLDMWKGVRRGHTPVEWVQRVLPLCSWAGP